MPCTTLLVGKKVSYDGSTVVARNEDNGGELFSPKKFVVVKPDDQPREYESVISKVKITLPDDPMRYTCMPNAVNDEGIWGAAGFNTANVGMSATETLSANTRLLAADPLVKEGIGEEDLVTVTLPYIHTAREGVLRLGSLLEAYGTYEMNGIAFQDLEEIWWLESVGGHNWMARRIPDDCCMVAPNRQSMDRFDFTDAYGAQKENLCSAGLAGLIEANHLDLQLDAPAVRDNTAFDLRAAFGTWSLGDYYANSPRAWDILRRLAPTTYKWYGEDARYSPVCPDLPWIIRPEKKLTVEDVKAMMTAHFEMTPFDPYDNRNDPADRSRYRCVGVAQTNFLAILQLRPYVPQELAAVEWISVGANEFNASVPFYANVTDTPAFIRDTDGTVTTDSFYWNIRLVAAMADPYELQCRGCVDSYANTVWIEGHKAIAAVDAAYIKERPEDVTGYLTDANQKMTDRVQELTATLLRDVLKRSSLQMKNRYQWI